MKNLFLSLVSILILSGCQHGEPVKTYVFTHPDQCAKSTVVNQFQVSVDCGALGEYIQDIHAKIDFKIFDGSLCALLYSANACQRDNQGHWYPLPSGFMVYHNNEYAPVPLYYSENLGRFLTPSGFPVNFGTNDFRAKPQDILRISRYRPLYQHICFYYDEVNQQEMAFNMLSDRYYPDLLLARNNACKGAVYTPESYTHNRIISNLWL